MQSDDIYRQKLAQLSASVLAWSGFVADVARVDMSEDGPVWRFSMRPKAARACPCEIVLDAATQGFDLWIGGETYEGFALTSLDTVLPLLKAVADGHVVTRHYASAATGLPVSTSTVITLENGAQLEAGSAPTADGLECRPAHFVPYRKPGSSI